MRGMSPLWRKRLACAPTRPHIRTRRQWVLPLPCTSSVLILYLSASSFYLSPDPCHLRGSSPFYASFLQSCHPFGIFLFDSLALYLCIYNFYFLPFSYCFELQTSSFHASTLLPIYPSTNFAFNVASFRATPKNLLIRTPAPVCIFLPFCFNCPTEKTGTRHRERNIDQVP